MATDAASLKIISTWLSGLADLVPPTAAAPLTKNRIANLSMQLGELFPSGAFTSASMREVASGKEFFPGWEGLTASVERWWAANRPKLRSLPAGGAGADLDAMDRSWLAHWHTHASARREASDAIKASGRAYDPVQLPIGRLASLIRQQSPKAWAIISGSSGFSRPVPTEAEVEAVKDAAAAITRELQGIPGGQVARTMPVATQLVQLGPPPLPAPSAEVLRQREASPVVAAAKAAIDW